MRQCARIDRPPGEGGVVSYQQRLSTLEYHAQVDHKIAAEIGAEADARIAELENDAARYRWLRRRIRLTNEEMMSGAVKKCMTVRIAYSAMDHTTDPADAYLSKDRFNAECAALDAAIDAARKEQGNAG